MRRLVLLLTVLMVLIIPITAQSLDETLTLEFVGVSISYPTGWTGTSTSDLGFNIKENAGDENIFTATGMYIQGNIRGESLVPGTSLDDRIVTFIANNELMEVTGELRSTATIEYGYAVLDNRQFILLPVGADFLMLQIATPVRPINDPLVTAIIESVTVGAGDSDAPDPVTNDTPAEETDTNSVAPDANEDGYIPISYGDEVRGSLAEAKDEVLYTFTGNAGDSITLTMTADDENTLDTTLWFYTVDGYTINDHVGYNENAPTGGTNNSQIIATLPETGDYIVKATNLTGAGDYTLSLTSESAITTEIAYGESIQGTLPDDSTNDLYTFTGNVGDSITLTMIAEDEDALDTHLALHTADGYGTGDPVAENDDNIAVGIRNSQIIVDLPETGDYIIEASRFDGFGNYTISLESDNIPLSDSATVEDDTPEETVETIKQWATSATASSEYGNPDWSAMQATGEPNALACEDSVNAWASATGEGQESLTLTFEQPVQPTQVNIHQNLTPGSIVRVELINASNGDIIEIPESADPGATPCPRIFALDITDVDAAVTGVVVHLDESIGGYWNEIDAVELVGRPTDVEIAEISLPNTIEDTQATAGNLSLDYPAQWVASNIGANLLIAADSPTTIDMATTNTVSLDSENAYTFVAEAETIVNVSSGDLETINSAILEVITADPADTYGETEIITTDSGRVIAKTYTTSGGFDGYMYVAFVDDVAVGMQGVAGNITAWESTFDAIFASITLAGEAPASNEGNATNTDNNATDAITTTTDTRATLTDPDR